MDNTRKITFSGEDGEEAEDFILAIRQLAYSQKKQDDNKWILDFVSTCLVRGALRWHATLDEHTQDSWPLLQKALLARLKPLFKGINGAECERFVRMANQRALDEGRQHDSAWIAASVSASFDGDALRWYSGLDKEIRQDWDLLQRELFLKYPSTEGRFVEEMPSHLVPVAAAAPPILQAALPTPKALPPVPEVEIQSLHYSIAYREPEVLELPSPEPGVLRGRIRVVTENAAARRYISLVLHQYGACQITSSLDDALLVEYTVSATPGPHSLRLVSPGRWQSLGARWNNSGSRSTGKSDSLSAYVVLIQGSSPGSLKASWGTSGEVLRKMWRVADDGAITATWRQPSGGVHVFVPRVAISTKLLVLTGATSFLDGNLAFAKGRLVFEAI